MSMKIHQSIATYILSITLFFMVIMTAPALFNQYTLAKLAVLGIGSSLCLILTIQDWRYHKKILTIAMLILASQMISFIFSTNRIISFLGYPTQEAYGLFATLSILPFALSYASLPNKGKQTVVHFFLAAAALASGVCIFQAIETGSRPTGLEGQPILSAAVIAVAFLIALAASIRSFIKTNYIPAVLHLLLAGFLFTGIIAAESNSILLGMLISAAGTLFIVLITHTRGASRMIMIALVSLLAIFCIRSMLISESFSLNQRMREYQTVITLFKSKLVTQPTRMIAGYGQNTTGDYYRLYFNRTSLPESEKNWDLTHIRSLFAEYLFTGGIIMLGIFLILLALVLNKTVKQQEYDKLVLLLFFIFLSTIYLFSITLFTLLFSFLFSSLTLGNENSTKRERKEDIHGRRLLTIRAVATLYAFVIVATTVLFVSADFSYAKGNRELASRLNPISFLYPFSSGYSGYETLFTKRAEGCMTKRQCYQNYHTLYLSSYEGLIQSIALNPYDPYSYNLLGTVQMYEWYDRGEKDRKLLNQSLQNHQKALALDPTNYEYANNVGNVYMSLGDVKQAEYYFLMAIQLDPRFSGSYVHLRDLYKSQGKIKEAESIEKIISSLD